MTWFILFYVVLNIAVILGVNTWCYYWYNRKWPDDRLPWSTGFRGGK